MIYNDKHALAGSYIKRAFQMSAQLEIKYTISDAIKYNSNLIYKSLFGIVGLVEALPDMVSIPIGMVEFK